MYGQGIRIRSILVGDWILSVMNGMNIYKCIFYISIDGSADLHCMQYYIITFCDQMSRLPQGGLQLERSSQQTHPACYEPEMRTGKDQRPGD
jgi:hypothetical protein